MVDAKSKQISTNLEERYNTASRLLTVRLLLIIILYLHVTNCYLSITFAIEVLSLISDINGHLSSETAFINIKF